MDDMRYSFQTFSEYQEALRLLRRYRRMRGALGRRAFAHFLDACTQTVPAKAEYACDADRAKIIEKLCETFPDLLTDAVCARLDACENPALTGGARIFVGDEMVDASFARARRDILSSL